VQVVTFNENICPEDVHLAPDKSREVV
jgi:hypothetical protein